MRKIIEAMEQASAEASDHEAERLRAFEELADAQRGAPEIAMVRAQHALSGGVLSSCIEHVGDLTHRMSEFPDRIPNCGYEFVKPKVERCLSMLSSTYWDRTKDRHGFYAEFMQNMDNNGKYHGMTGEEWLEKAKPALQRYADEHRKLKVYNLMQSLAKDAAVALGELRFDDAKRFLASLDRHLVDPQTWTKAASKYQPGYASKRLHESDVHTYVAYHGARQKIEHWDEGETYFAADPKEAQTYGSIIYKCRLTIRKPYRTEDYDEFAEAEMSGLWRTLAQQGYDGIILGEGEREDEQFITFSPRQIEELEVFTKNEG